MELTAEQRTAIYTHDRNLIVVAGAGSGKTHVLVERYLSLLDANRNWPLTALVAITFTRKAAQEMRDRVRRELERRRDSAPDEPCWSDWLASVDSARIDTIHGLCASILRANAAEAGVDPKFEVLEEVEAWLLLEDAIEQVLQTVVSEDDACAALLLEYGADTVRKALEHLITADITDPPPDPFAEWQRRWDAGFARALDNLTADAAFWNAANWSPERWPDEDCGDRLLAVWRACWDALAVLDQRADGAACLEALKTLKAIKTNIGSAVNWGCKDTLDEAKAALQSLRQTACALLDVIGDPPGDLDRRAAGFMPLWCTLIRRTQQTYRDMKQANGVLDFDDLERLTCRLLAEHPAVCARYRNAEFKHLLVDEFQDTNAAQWEIVRHLADPAQPGSLFVVGDEKQSIYQFRGADVSVFGHVRQVIVDTGGSAVPLAQSFRAHRRLVECFNHVFAHVLQKDPASPVADYEVEFGNGMTAFRAEAPADTPALELLLLNKSLLDGDDKADTCRRWEAYEIAAYLRCAVGADGQPPRRVYDKQTRSHRAMHYGDAAILFQSTTHITLYEDALKAAGVPYVTVAGRGYYSRQEVWDVLNLLTALHNPADSLALAAALRSPLFNLSDDALLALRLCRDDSGQRLLWDALDSADHVPDDELPLVAFARDTLRSLRGLAGRITIAELLREILAQTGYLATLTALPDGARRRGNVEKLLEKAQASGQVMLGAFSQYLRDLSEREAREGEALVDTQGAVTLMTVHASKGLEFPLVVLANADWERSFYGGAAVLHHPDHGLTCKVYNPVKEKLEGGFAHTQAETLLRRREETERKRLLYVAATRAQDYLLVSGQIAQYQNGNWKLGGWLNWLWQGLGLDGVAPQTSTLNHYAWGAVSLTVPQQVPPPEALLRGDEPADTAWNHDAVQQGKPLSDTIQPPLLLQPVPVVADAPARHLTATQLADLGSAPYDTYFRDRFRRGVLHDAPARIDTVSAPKGDVSLRLVGDIVHKVLGMDRPPGWWQAPDERDNLNRILRSYAWQLGVVVPRQQQIAIMEARRLLDRFIESDVYHRLSAAQTLFRELPFVYRSDKRIIHGVLDVLFHSNDSWTIIDYKTSYVRDYLGDSTAIYHHARRYHLQVGVYAAAARQQLDGITPNVYIHYIRYGQTVRVETNEWESALARLEVYIGDLLLSRE
ncbi:MAG: UvrD-helicase domain-containing protein [Chloroflexi bacterium]|nr:UvrD-helicase domain-containing protein [Chloroflexota bacterium]